MVARQIYNQSVCNCHEDSSLVRIIDLVEMVYSAPDGPQRNYYWQNLQEALHEFLDDFLPHMEEEENTFQPLLNEFFNYEELKQIQETVLYQHQEWQDKGTTEKSLKRFKRDSECTEYTTTGNKPDNENDYFERLPEEIIHQIFNFFDDPRDLSRSGRVCSRWNKVSKSPSFWRSLPMSSWLQGHWQWSSLDPADLIEQSDFMSENVNNFYDRCQEHLKTIGKSSDVKSKGRNTEHSYFFEGSSVRKVSVAGSKVLTNANLRQILKVSLSHGL